MRRDKLRCMGSWNYCSKWVRGAETCMIKSCHFVFLDQSAWAAEVQISFFFFQLLLIYFSFEFVRIAIPPSQCLVTSAADGREHVNLSSCSPAESHCSGAAVEKVWRAPPESPFNSVWSRKYKTVEHPRSGRSRRLLLLPCWDARVLPSFCPPVSPCVSLRPWIKAQTLSMTLRSLSPSFAVYSSIFEACLKHVLFLWHWPYERMFLYSI